MSWFNPPPFDPSIVPPKTPPKIVVPSFIKEDGQILNLLTHHGAGNVIRDYSGFANHGVFAAPPQDPVWIDGPYGWALGYNGNQYVNCGDAASLRVVGDITVEIWSMIPPTIAVGPLITKYDFGGDSGWQLFHNPASQIIFGGRDGTGVFVQSGPGPVIDDDIWHFIVGQREGTVWRVITDMGIPIQVNVGTAGDISAPGINLESGRSLGVNYIIGTQTLSRVYNRNLSIPELTRHFESTRPIFGV